MVKFLMNKFKKLSIPYLIWMSVLILLPILILIIMSFQTTKGIRIFEGTFTFNNFSRVFSHEILKRFGLSFLYSMVATICCLIIAYPVAYTIAHSHFKHKFLILMLLILPMWSNTLLRTKGIASLFMDGNVIRSIFEKINIHLPSLDWYGKPIGVIIGMVATYLPFMIFPIYNAIEKIDDSLYDASDDLGANHFKTFWKVTFPISLKGVTTGIILVFLPCATGFGVVELLGEYGLIGTYIQAEFSSPESYGTGALVSLVILVVISGALLIVGKVDKEGETLL